MSIKKKVIKGFLFSILVIVFVVLGYLLYVFLQYNRIEDYQQLAVQNRKDSQLAVNQEYTIFTQNVGFGAYTPDFTFFMDGGHQSWGNSPESVTNCVQGAIETAKLFDPDFVLFQEVDEDSTRSYHINEQEMIANAFAEYSNVVATNFHSAFLMYPLYQPHGKSNSGIMTLGKYGFTSAVRRQFPVSTSISKFVDLDRCYSVSRIPVENGKELVLYNVHSSAYGGSEEIRTAQMTMLFQDMKQEYAAGNYCVCGGDFNHDFTGDATMQLNPALEDVDFGWAKPFPVELLPEGIHRCISYKDGEVVATCRNCDVPYNDEQFVTIVDGFLVSDNIETVEVFNYWTAFEYSDHCPVVMKFMLAE